MTRHIVLPLLNWRVNLIWHSLKEIAFETNDLPPLIGFTKSTNVKVSPMADINVFGIYEPCWMPAARATELRQQVVTNYARPCHTYGWRVFCFNGSVTLPILLTMKYREERRQYHGDF